MFKRDHNRRQLTEIQDRLPGRFKLLITDNLLPGIETDDYFDSTVIKNIEGLIQNHGSEMKRFIFGKTSRDKTRGGQKPVNPFIDERTIEHIIVYPGIIRFNGDNIRQFTKDLGLHDSPKGFDLLGNRSSGAFDFQRNGEGGKKIQWITVSKIHLFPKPVVFLYIFFKTFIQTIFPDPSIPAPVINLIGPCILCIFRYIGITGIYQVVGTDLLGQVHLRG